MVDLIGREILCFGGDNPRRHLLLTLDGSELAYLQWERSFPPVVKGEMLRQVLWVRGWGLRPLRVGIWRAGARVPGLVFAGGPAWGLARTGDGFAYELRRGVPAGGGATQEFIDELDSRVLQASARLGGSVGGWALVVRVADRVQHPPDLPGLLLLWGMLRLCRWNSPWLGWTSSNVGPGAIERAVDEMLRATVD